MEVRWLCLELNSVSPRSPLASLGGSIRGLVHASPLTGSVWYWSCGMHHADVAAESFSTLLEINPSRQQKIIKLNHLQQVHFDLQENTDMSSKILVTWTYSSVHVEHRGQTRYKKFSWLHSFYYHVLSCSIWIGVEIRSLHTFPLNVQWTGHRPKESKKWKLVI